MKKLFLFLFTAFLFFNNLETFAQIVVTNVQPLYGGRINAIASAPVTGTTDKHHVYITTESANTAFYAQATVNNTTVASITSFASVPGLLAADGYGSNVQRIGAHGASGLMYFMKEGVVYRASATSAAVSTFKTFGLDTSLNDFLVKDSKIWYFFKVFSSNQDRIAYSDLNASGNATNFVSNNSYINNGIYPAKNNITYTYSDSIILMKQGNNPEITIVADLVTGSTALLHDQLTGLRNSVFWRCAAVAPDGTIFIGGSDNVHKYIAYKAKTSSVWTEINTGIDGTFCQNIEFYENIPGNYYVYFGSGYSNAKGIASSWTKFGNVSLETHSNDGSILTIGTNATGGVSILTTDQGIGWTRNSGSVLTEINDGVVAVQVNDFDMRSQKDTGWLASKAGVRAVSDYNGASRTWTRPMFPNGDGSPYYAAEMAGNNGKTAYVGNVRVYKTTDYGANWTRVFTPENAPYNFSHHVQVTSISVSDVDNNMVLAGVKDLADTARGGVFYSKDAGATWTQLLIHATTVGQDIDVNDIETTYETGKIVAYIGVDYDSTTSPIIAGIYKAEWNGTAWTVTKESVYGSTSSLVRVSDIHIHSKDTIIAVGGYHNSVYEYPLHMQLSKTTSAGWTSSVAPSKTGFYNACSWYGDTLFYSLKENINYARLGFTTSGSYFIETEKLYKAVDIGTEVNVLYYDELLAGTSVGFYAFVGSNASTLPLQITEFYATATVNGNQITWKNESDNEIVNYQLQSSCSGTSFNTIATIASNNSKQYSITDKSNCGITYYRLKTLNNKGTTEYSNTIKVIQNVIHSLKVYPNPITQGFLVMEAFNNAKNTVTIYDYLGKEKMKQHFEPASIIKINVDHLQKGTYILQVSSGTEKKVTTIIIK